MDNLTSFGIPTFISTIVPHGKASESSDLNPLTFLQTLAHCIKKSVSDGMEMARNA